MHRLFVGLRPPPHIRQHMSSVMKAVPGARWQDDDQLHITLRFIGEVNRRVAEDVALALSAVRVPTMQLAITGVGQFDRRGRPNALWAGVRPHDVLQVLHKKVDQALVRIGLPPERRAYLPHVTLARLGAGAGTERWLAEHAALAGPFFVADAFLLFESHLSSGGTSYAAVERYQLTD